MDNCNGNIHPREAADKDKMAQIIVATGRGGTGKTTFVALASRYLQTPQLLIDADNDQNLAAMLGIDLAEQGIRTISEVLYDIQDRDSNSYRELHAMPLAQKVEYLLHMDCLYESADFDMVSIGVKWTQGCYCHPNDILRAVLPGLTKNYTYTLIDSPAGLEHINRRIATEIGAIFAIVDPSAKSLRNVDRLKEISQEIGIHYQNLYLVANHRFTDDMTKRLEQVSAATYLGRIEKDPSVEEYDWQGRSLRDLPSNSPACLSVEKILTKAALMSTPESTKPCL